MQKKYIVYLFRAEDCKRKWLAYLKNETGDFTLKIVVYAETGAKAKNKAITLANKNFENVEILEKNYTHHLWGIDNFPALNFLKSTT